MSTRLVFALDIFEDGDARPKQISLLDPAVFGAGVRPFEVVGDEAELADLDAARLTQGVLAVDGTSVAVAGEFLFRAVCSHPVLAAQLQQLLTFPPPDGCPILVSFANHGAENLPFEALYAPATDFPTLTEGARFLGLDGRWPIGRTVRTGTVAQSPPAFAPPLKIVAVLSALGVPAAPEWEALARALQAPGAVPTETLVLVSERPLAETIVGAGVPGVTVELVPGTVALLQARIQLMNPHVLHFFCHGSAAGGGQLQIAFANDRVAGSPVSSLIMDSNDVRRCSTPGKPPIWLAVLNCCSSAQSEDGPADVTGRRLSSLGLQLLQDGAFNAVIGMREPVLDADAACFTGAFYGALLSELQNRVAQGRSGPLLWPALVVPARQEIARRAGNALARTAAADKAWTLPVVFVQDAPFDLPVRVQPAPVAAGEPAGILPVDPQRSARLQIDLLRGILSQLSPDAPASLRAEIEATIAHLGSGSP